MYSQLKSLSMKSQRRKRSKTKREQEIHHIRRLDQKGFSQILYHLDFKLGVHQKLILLEEVQG